MRKVDERKPFRYNLRSRKGDLEEEKTPLLDSKPFPGIEKHYISKAKGKAPIKVAKLASKMVEDPRYKPMQEGYKNYCRIFVARRALYSKITSSSPF